MTKNIDSVYFLCFDGWENELRSNRWHYASRWAREVPVVVVQIRSDMLDGAPQAVPDSRAEGIECLHVARGREENVFLRNVRQVRDIADHMQQRGHHKPLLWIYDPRLFWAAAFLPAEGRIFHATENYYDFEKLDLSFHENLSAALKLVDGVVSVSDGVAASYVPFVSNGIKVSTNGCDWPLFSQAEPDVELTSLARGRKLAVYAGNINGRIDFDLVLAAVRRYPETLFAFFGPTSGLSASQEATWATVTACDNVRDFGPVSPDRLPGLYKAADIGIIPYTQDRLIVANGFPLKTFEMIAAGLPVVSTMMRPLLPHAASWLAVCTDSRDFLAALSQVSRRTLTDAERLDLERAAREQDYEAKFSAVRDYSLKVAERRKAGSIPLADIASVTGVEWARSLANEFIANGLPMLKRARLRTCLMRIVTPVDRAVVALFRRLRPASAPIAIQQLLAVSHSQVPPVQLQQAPVRNPETPLHLLLLCDYHAGTAGTIIDHIEGLRDLSRHKITVLSSLGELPEGIELERFDGIIIHYSLVACMDQFIGPKARSAIRAFGGLKIAFVQDDYRFINKTVAAYRDLGIHILFGLAPLDIIDHVYSPEALPGVLRETVLAGYVPEHLTKLAVPSYAERALDIGYRARRLPAWIGSHAQEKWVIADRVLADAPRYSLRCDISTREADRIYGDEWIKFITSCKAMLGAESGSGVCDFTGEIQEKVEAHVAREPNVSFEELRELYFKDEDGRLMMNVISPRCFEAAALRTLMILYEGDYSGRLTAWRHYVPLRRDHSNMDQVVALLRDPARAQEIVDRAYHEVALNSDNWFSAMVRQMDDAIARRLEPGMLSQRKPYTPAEFVAIQRRAAAKGRWRRQLGRLASEAIPLVDIALKLFPQEFSSHIRVRLQRIWRILLGAESSSASRQQTYYRLLRYKGPSHVWRATRLLKANPGLAAELHFVSGLVGAGARCCGIRFDPLSRALELDFGFGQVPETLSAVWLKELFRNSSLSVVRLGIQGAQPIEIPGIRSGETAEFAVTRHGAQDVWEILAWVFPELNGTNATLLLGAV